MKPPPRAAVLHPNGVLDGNAMLDGTRARGAPPVRTADVVAAEGHHALVQNAQRGDKKAFAALVEEYQQTVYGFLRARMLEPADAEDLCQEVFLRCYVGRENLTRASAVGSWLVGIARNVLHEHIRERQRRKEVAWTELCLELDTLVGQHHGESDDALHHLPSCLESLGQSAREAIDLRFSSAMKWTEIGVRLKRSDGAVKLLVHRARQALKHCLDRKLRPAP
jgi:RNA polymerase sigma-70 factor, ECF subfamily